MELDPRLRSSDAGQGPSTPSPLSHSAAKTDHGQSPAAPLTIVDGAESASSSHDSPSQPRQQHAGNGNENGIDHDAAGDANKKSRACEACRGLKVRCEPDPDDDAAPCKRCGKAGRNCVVTLPTRKRQKKTDSRVSELEKKIDALTASLQARSSSGAAAVHGAAQSRPIIGLSAQKQATPDVFPELWIGNDSPKPWPSLDTAEDSHSASSRPPAARSHGVPEAATGAKRKATAELRGDAASTPEHTASPAAAAAGPLSHQSPLKHNRRPDIVDRGVIGVEKAVELFQRYKEHMLRHLPAVVFPPNVSAMELRWSKPYLFLAVMAAASSETQGLQQMLQKELMELFAEKVVVVGEKNLELVQALHVAVIWYWPPEHFEQLKFYQLVHMSAVMALDIGLGKKSWPRKGKSGFSWREQAYGSHAQAEPTSLECRRTWLTCHFLAANTAMSLHRPNLIRWSPFMTESLEMLRTSPDAYPTDAYFCHLVWTHRMAEDVGIQLSMDDPDAAIHIADARTQYVLKGLERDLYRNTGTIPREMMQPTLQMGLCNLDLYMHELALRTDTDSSDILDGDIMHSQQQQQQQPPLSAAYIRALSASLSAIDTMFQTFLGMDVFAIRCLPVYTFVRVAYAIVVLMKIYFAASKPSSELAKVISREDLRVAYHLEALLDKFFAAAADDKCRPASKFLRVLVMLRTWFLKHGKAEAAQQHNGDDDASAQAQQQQQQHHILQANTPLQVLSEVAMGRESSSSSNTPRPFYTALHPPMPAGSGPPPPALSTQTSYFHDAPVPVPVPVPAPSSSSPSTQRADAAGPSYQQPPPQWTTGQPDAAAAAAAAAVPNLPPDMTIGFPAGFDFDSLGVPLNQSGEMYGGGATMVMNDPLFSDMFQTLPNPNLFSF